MKVNMRPFKKEGYVVAPTQDKLLVNRNKED